MKFIVVGIFGSYTEAEAAVLDLDLRGIGGNQVEMISDIDEDARTANTPGEPSTRPNETLHARLARVFGLDGGLDRGARGDAGGDLEKSEVRDTPGEQPNYIGEQEFYANHVKQGGAVLIVRTESEQNANEAAAILREHGARTPGRKDGPAVRRVASGG